jgi:uncharacterized protein (TIGR02246 family)
MATQPPEAIYQQFAQALNSGDTAALSALFEENAMIVPQPGQPPITGAQAIAGYWQACVGFQPQIQMELQSAIQTGDIALLRNTWQTTVTGPDGKPISGSGRGIQVVRRQADGSWRYLVDDAWAG